VSPVEEATLFGWDRLRHGGLLLDPPRLRLIAARQPTQPMLPHLEKELRRQVAQAQDGTLKAGDFAAFVLGEICGFTAGIGTWQRGSAVGTEWARIGVAGEAIKPRHLWRGDFGAILPVFIDTESRLGIGRGTRAASQMLQWLRAGKERLALLTNGRQLRLVFGGLDFDAWCQWDVDLWFEEGAIGPQVIALRTLLQPALWTPTNQHATPALLQAILDSRKGQAELSAVLGERVREAVEVLVQAHGDVLKRECADTDPSDIYRAAVRMVMRLVVVLFAESREKLLPRDNALYHRAYGLTGLREELDKVAARAGSRLKRSSSAWPRVLALFRLIFAGSHHPDLPVPEYGGELFQRGDPKSSEGLVRALSVFETACFDHDLLLPDSDVHQMLELLTRTKVRIRQGRANTWAPVPVDFSDLSSEYIGILYEGLLDFELKTAPSGDPVIFLAVGNQPALPLSRLEGMDDKAVASLLEKMKDISGPPAEEEGADADNDDDQDEVDEVEDEDDDASLADESAPADETLDNGDERFITRTRAEEWARRAVAVGKLVPKPKGAQRRQEWDDKVGRKARQIVARVVLPGEWYLVRWGGTRKGSGTFYTRPGLAVPTVHRTLRPLAYEAPNGGDGTPNLDAPASQWLPRTPEEILALKVCDPACGSGTFPVAALRFLTDALYRSLHHHGRISETGDRAIVRLLDRAASWQAEDLLGTENLACRPSDETFEPRLKAVLRRHVVERCIYGVDLDPLAVELCRLALWIETMDRTLPFSFLDHKVKCGNSLLGAWLDQFLYYPVMAWKSREGGDKGHSNGVHFQNDARGKTFKAFSAEKVAPDLQRLLEGRTLFSEDLLGQATAVHNAALEALSRLHDLPVHDAAERSRLYREALVGSSAYQSLKAALDLWCACWFWSAGDLEHAPLPTTLVNPTPASCAVVGRIAADYRFFHWELEFPDVFRGQGSGFDAVLGNPPWDIAKPNSKEFFSNLDPLYRGLGNPEARQTELFADADVERNWLDYCERFVSWSNYVKFASNPFGDPEQAATAGNSFGVVRGKANARLHAAWRAARSRAQGFSDPCHPFRSQGGSDLNLYKLFVEQMVRMLRPGGRVGLVLPAAIYNDSGAAPLRRLLLTQCELQWLFGFENRAKIFPIDSRFRFCCLIARRGSSTRQVQLAFGRRDLVDWAEAERFVIQVAGDDLHLFSPISSAIPEVESIQDSDVMRTLFAKGTLLGSDEAAALGVKYVSEYHMTQARKAGQYVPKDTALASAVRIAPGHWRSGEQMFVAFYTGKMVAQFDFAFQRWVSGHAARATWAPLGFTEKEWVPEFVAPLSAVRHQWRGGTRLVFRDIARATDERTTLASVIPAWPCGNKVPLIAEEGQVSVARQLALCCVMNSFAYDFVVRNRITGINLNKFIIDETPVPDLTTIPVELSVIGACLCMVHEVFAGAWLELHHECPELGEKPWKEHWAIQPADRLERRAASEAIVAHLYGLDEQQFRWVLRNCDYPRNQLANDSFRGQLPAKGFWRTGVGSAEHPLRQAWTCDPEFRLTNLAVVAFVELERLKANMGGDLSAAVCAFAPASGHRGWTLPERLRLRDYGLGHDHRADEPQVLRSALQVEGSRVEGDAQSSWRECERVAEDIRALWGDASKFAAGPPNVTVHPGPGSGRVPAASQGALFRSDE
jgi:hypothetical protein